MNEQHKALALVRIEKAEHCIDSANAMIEIGNSEEGKEVISIYSHEGYLKAESANYDKEREAQELIKKLSK